MTLNELELFAIVSVFSTSDPFDVAIRKGTTTAIVTDREFTEVGFFTTFKVLTDLPASPQRSMWDCEFEHCSVSHGGSFIIWREAHDVFVIEGFVYEGIWPSEFDSANFQIV